MPPDVPEPAPSASTSNDPSPAPTPRTERDPGWLREFFRSSWGCNTLEFLTLLVVGSYFMFWALVPYFGGARLGLVGADEPRYAQIAREMLAVHNADCDKVHAKIVPHSVEPQAVHASYQCLVGGTVTPILYGRPWLEKPALYYWRAMGFFKEFGVSDWSARLPSATGCGFLILLVFGHLKRFRPGGHLDAALIVASSAAIVAFARGASTDMQLAAPFCIGMLGWYAWYETGKKFWLFDLYFFGAAATLAKGPIAPFMALSIICLFLGLRREWSALRRTLWWPGVILFLLMVLPWYIAVQHRNPTFFREFFYEHNVERFATDLYKHHQPAYYYLIVLVLGLMPWTALAFRALWDAVKTSIQEWKARRSPGHYLGHWRAGDAFPEFLVLWALFPIVFFSFSGSKLPGYILPSIPPLGILTGDYIFRVRRMGLPRWMIGVHAALTGILTFVLLLCPQYMVYSRIVPQAHTIVWAALWSLAAAMLVVAIVRRYGIRKIRLATLIPLVCLLFFLLNVHGDTLDLNYSARPLAREIAAADPQARQVAAQNVRRDLDYGMAFYRDQAIVHYATDGVPEAEHVLVIPTTEADRLPALLPGRVYQQLFLYDTRGLSVYKVYPRAPALTTAAVPERAGPHGHRDAGAQQPSR